MIKLITHNITSLLRQDNEVKKINFIGECTAFFKGKENALHNGINVLFDYYALVMKEFSK